MEKEAFIYEMKLMKRDLYMWKETSECMPHCGAKKLKLASTINGFIF